MQAKRTGKIIENLSVAIPNSMKVKARLLIFFPEQAILFIFLHFQGKNIYIRTIQASSESNGRPLKLPSHQIAEPLILTALIEERIHL